MGVGAMGTAGASAAGMGVGAVRRGGRRHEAQGEAERMPGCARSRLFTIH